MTTHRYTTSDHWERAICSRVQEALAGPFADALCDIVRREFEAVRDTRSDMEDCDSREVLRHEYTASLGTLERDVLLQYATDGLRLAERDAREGKQ